MSEMSSEELASLLAEEQASAEFFYTTHTPHEWSSGAKMHRYDLEKGGPIASLDRARELALAARRGTPGHSGYVETTYGMACTVSPRA